MGIPDQVVSTTIRLEAILKERMRNRLLHLKTMSDVMIDAENKAFVFGQRTEVVKLGQLLFGETFGKELSDI